MNTMQELEDPKSRKLAQRRNEEALDSGDASRRLKHKKGKYIPRPEVDTMHGMMIDAGSQGTRIHIYEFDRRILYTSHELTRALNGYEISIPTTNTRWTNRLKPGLDSLAFIPDELELRDSVASYLAPLFSFAKTVLKEKQDDWDRYPIYLKATGGLRTLPTSDRVRLVHAVREVFRNTTFNPFNFDDSERVRVISGEEEAIYGWTAVNFAMGTLVQDTEGTGTALNPKKTWGMLEMGGASTQIAWFQNQGDVMANLMKVQIGGARHWNVYAHSFLYFGINGAWSRLNALLHMNGQGTHRNPCLPSNSTTPFSSWIHWDDMERPFPRSDPRSTPYQIEMYNEAPDFQLCTKLTQNLLRKEANAEWVMFSHDGDCSFAGVYQPPLPQTNSAIDEFVVTSNYFTVWEFLQLPDRTQVSDIRDGARRVCEMDATALREYNSNLDDPVKDEQLFQYCFRSTFVFEILHTGYGFPLDYEIVAADVVNGQKVGWALGSILYEINTLPWEFGGKLSSKSHKPGHASQTTLFGVGLPSGGDHDTSGGFPFAGVVLAGFILALSWIVSRRRRTANGSYSEIPSN